MGAGKTYAKNQFIKKLVTNSPQLRTLDVDCNRLYSISNAASLEEVAVELRARSGYGHVTAVGQHGQTGALCFALGPQLLPTYTIAGQRPWSGLLFALPWAGAAAAHTPQCQPLIPHPCYPALAEGAVVYHPSAHGTPPFYIPDGLPRERPEG